MKNDSPSLTSREVSCLSYVSVGESTRMIAGKLQISERTVNFHINNAMTKLDARSRSHAAVLATRLGLIQENPD